MDSTERRVAAGAEGERTARRGSGTPARPAVLARREPGHAGRVRERSVAGIVGYGVLGLAWASLALLFAMVFAPFAEDATRARSLAQQSRPSVATGEARGPRADVAPVPRLRPPELRGGGGGEAANGAQDALVAVEPDTAGVESLLAPEGAGIVPVAECIGVDLSGAPVPPKSCLCGEHVRHGRPPVLLRVSVDGREGQMLAAQVSCAAYPTQASAQIAFRTNPVGLVHLDEDGNGIACEANPCPCDQTPVAMPPPRPAAPAQPAPAPAPAEEAASPPQPAADCCRGRRTARRRTARLVCSSGSGG